MTTVPRHPVDREAASREVEAAEPRLGQFLGYVEKKADAVDTVFRWAGLVARNRTVLDPGAADPATWRAFDLTGQAAAATFAMAGASEGTVGYQLGDNRFQLPATGPARHANAGKWLTAVWYAVVLRDDARVQELCAVPLDLLRASGVDHDPYVYPWIESLQAFLRRERVPPSMFTPAMDGTDPDSARITPRGAMLQLVYPPIKMFYYILRRDAERFNDALVQALELHREYWTARDRATDSEGFVALAPLAVAVLGQAVGFTLDVESDYLPAGLLSGSRP
ncbi:immunity 49 family protein [Amycolatopsis thermoflava]|uniref:immunity 49 family protein n=1 Tax=Amycolatopsis thermoflava TaxID=84480 RepID=UPI00040E955A|nr:immunity 49 family protein [Amycolatopsis thermoflava]